MTKKSIIEQETYFVVIRDLHSFDEVKNAVVPTAMIVKHSAIQKALEELKKKSCCISEGSYYSHGNHSCNNKKAGRECGIVIKWSDVEKCFEVKDAKNK